jgi:hypothetical protein
MKNIHVIPTFSPSKIFYIAENFHLEKGQLIEPKSYHNVYITSDEEIKEGNWLIWNSKVYKDSKRSFTGVDYSQYEKIILTTDPKLIADGVQAIADTFLEWFVKNPSCESIEINEEPIFKSFETRFDSIGYQYKIIIPKEEPTPVWKQIIESCGGEEEFGSEEPKQEVWKDIPNYEGLYKVSNFGNVKSLERYVKGKVENRLQKENILSKRLVGNLGNQYYAVTLCNNKDRKQIKVSVLVAMAFLNHIPNGYVGFTVDHIDNNPLNNNVNNLQVITKRENSSKDRKGISKYTGVTFNKKSNKWRSQIWIDGKNKTLGSFDDELDAHRAYQKELQQHLKS